MTRHILVTAPSLAEAGLSLLREGDCDIHFLGDFADGAGLLDILSRQPIAGIISRTMHLTGDILSLCPTLRVISKHGTGTSNIDMAAADARGIAVFSTPGANARSVAEFTIGLMLAAIRRIPRFDRSVRAGQWVRSGDGAELAGKTLGLVGFGRIARHVARVALALDMTVIAFDPLLAAPDMATVGVERAPDLESLLRRADVLSLHCPAQRGAPALIDAAALRLLPAGAIVVNTARGELVDEAALVAALDDGLVSAAALDTFVTEPLADSPLRRHPAVVLTPHVGGSTGAALDRMARQAARNLLGYLDAVEGRAALAHDLVALCLNPAVLRRREAALAAG